MLAYILIAKVFRGKKKQKPHYQMNNSGTYRHCLTEPTDPGCIANIEIDLPKQTVTFAIKVLTVTKPLLNRY